MEKGESVDDRGDDDGLRGRRAASPTVGAVVVHGNEASPETGTAIPGAIRLTVSAEADTLATAVADAGRSFT